jgi:hypothetical protein
MNQPYLSVVAASRNDDHGGDPLRRTQIFINCFARQCEKHRLPAELILVDWNPVPDRPGLAAVLQLPPASAYCTARVITVPASLHARIKYGDKLAFFQMIAKNAGIRRARGRFVLATNIDIIFSDELMAFIGRQQLDPRKMYRTDRHDMQAGLSENLTLEETLAYAWANPIRCHRRLGPSVLLDALYRTRDHVRACTPDLDAVRRVGGVALREQDGVWQLGVERNASIEHLHTNGCGDFTLLAREAWAAIRGYPEFEAFSFNIDSMGLVAAHYAGYEEVSLLPPCVCFHIEHSLGSGWTPEGETKLFQRLRQSAILNPEWPVLLPLVDRMRRERRALDFNHAGWGLADFNLPEQRLGEATPLPPPAAEVAREVAAINPAYDLDRLTLAHERRLAETAVIGNSDADADIVQLFVPDAAGGYAEATSRIFRGSLRQRTTVVFRLEPFAHQHPLRLDPCARAGLVEIASVTYLDAGSGRTLARLDGRDAARCQVGGSARLIASAPDSAGTPQPLYLLSTGDDPQLVLPPPGAAPQFPLLLLVELRLFPT